MQYRSLFGKDPAMPLSPTCKAQKTVTNKAERICSAQLGFILAACLLMMPLLFACDSRTPQPPSTQPAGVPAPGSMGATLLETRCSVCHSADRPKGARKTRAEWERTVTRMIGNGAQLAEAEKAVLIDHLAKTYGQ